MGCGSLVFSAVLAAKLPWAQSDFSIVLATSVLFAGTGVLIFRTTPYPSETKLRHGLYAMGILALAFTVVVAVLAALGVLTFLVKGG
jgi:hypothetical protein